MTTQLIQSGGIQQTFDYSALASQIIYLDFDGELTTYHNSDLGINVDVAVEDSHLSQERIAQIVAALNEQFAGQNVKFVSDNSGLSDYSTIYIGKTSSFEPYGSFAGLAETVDSGNKIKNDNAFVILDSASDNSQIINTIAHEAGHLLGTLEHEGEGLEKYKSTILYNQTFTGILPYSSGYNHITQLVLQYLDSKSTGSTGPITYRYDKADGAIINSGGSMIVYSGSYANNIQLNTGGFICIYKGATAQGLICNGGTISNCDNITLGDNTLFLNNSRSHGGAIYNSGSITIGNNATFSGNYAITRGGAIYNERGCTITIGNNAAFYDNYENAICNPGGNISIGDYVIFSGNHDGIAGGAIDNYCHGTYVGSMGIGHHAVFTGNYADYGGAIHNSSGSMQIGSHAEFAGNSAMHGGVIYNVYGSMYIGDASLFSKNSASSNGGAIDNVGIITFGTSVAFTENTACEKGGAIYNKYASMTFDSAAVFTGNSAFAGGAVYNGTQMIFNEGAVYSGNSAMNGGAVYNANNMTFGHVIFYGNSAGSRGGAIYNYDYGSMTFDNAEFSGNSAGSCGGAIYNYNFHGNMIFENAVFNENSAEYYGGVIYNSTGSMTLSSASFSGNSAGSNGGVIYNNYSGSIVLSSAVFNENSAGNCGGAIYNSTGKMTLSNASFNGNSAASDGGAVYASNGSMTLSNASFNGNSAASDGGAVYTSTGSMTFDNALFSGNSAGNCGGAIYNNFQGRITLSDVTFSGNSAGSFGGAIYNEYYSKYTYGRINLTDVRFATASDTIYNKGSMTFAGTVSIAGNLYTDREIDATGANMIFDISSYKEENDIEIISDLSKISGAASWSIEVDTSQQNGTYKLADGTQNFNEILTVKTDTSTLGTVSADNDLTVDGKTYSLVKNDSILSLTVVDKVVVPDPYDLSGNDSGITWKGDSDSFVGAYTKDEYAHSLVFSTDKKAVDTYGMDGNYNWRVRNTDSETWVDGNTFTAQKSAEAQKLVSDADGNGDIFFGNAVGVWEKKYAAQHVGVGTWSGTGEKVQLEGKNQITDIFVGSEDANLLVLTDNAHGDALFVDDIYSAFPLEIQQSRIAQIDEIRAGVGDDIVDMTSDKFFYEGDGLTIRGGSGNDTIWANHGDNKLFGDAGDDRIVGASGDDVIAGGSGDDSLNGGGGNDVFCFCEDWGHDTVEQLADGTVTLWFASKNGTWDESAMKYTDGDNIVEVTGVSTVNIKYADDSAEYQSLVTQGAFMQESSEKIFEEENKGVIAKL